MNKEDMYQREQNKKAAMAAWFPEISIVGTYQYNSRNLSLLSEDASDALKNTGNTVQGDIRDKISSLLSDPVTGAIIQSSPELLAFVNSLGTMDIAGPLNALGAEIDNAFTLGINNVFAGAVTLTQPIFMGGKIISYNKIAALASDLAGAEYDAEYQAVLWNVEQAFRITKGTLEVRPMFHFTEKRIEAHVCICFVALKVYKELERLLKKSGCPYSVDGVLRIAEAIVTLEIALPKNGTTITRSIYTSKEEQDIAYLIETDGWLG